MTTEAEIIDVEHRLICRILTEPEEWAAVAAARITDKFFANPKHLRVWQAICAYQREYSTPPTVAMLRQDFPRETYQFIKCHEPIAFLLDELRHAHQGALIEQGIEQAATAWETGDYDAALKSLAHTQAEVHQDIPVADDMDLTKTGDERLAAYMERIGVDAEGIIGIPTGYRCLDLATGGLQPEQLIVLAGFAKNGKSFVLLDMARAAHRAGYSPLFIGFEMSGREQGERIDSARAGVSLTALRNGTLGKDDWELLKRSVRDLSEMNPFIISTDRSRTMTISGIAAKIEQLRPPIVFVDGAYMLEDENGEPRLTPRAIGNITNGFKRLAQTFRIPIVISTQGLESKADRGKGPKMNRRTVGYGGSFIYDADAAIGVEIHPDDTDIQILSIMASRTAPPQEFYIRRDWDKGAFEELDYNPFESDGGMNDEDDYGGY